MKILSTKRGCDIVINLPPKGLSNILGNQFPEMIYL